MTGPDGSPASPAHTAAPPPSTALGCLVLVARRRGLEGVEARLRAARPGGEPTLAALAGVAEGAGLRSRAVALSLDAIVPLAGLLPAVVRLRDGRYHVLDAVDDRGATPEAALLDPAAPDAPLRLARAAYERLATDEVLLLAATAETLPGAGPPGWRTLGAMVGRERRLVRDLALVSLALGLLALAPILIAQALLGDVAATPTRDTFAFLCCGLLVLALFEAAFTAVRHALVTRLSTRLGLRLEEGLVERMLDWPITVFETTAPGLIAHRIGAIGALRRALAVPLVSTLLDAGVLVVLVPAMARISVVMTLAAGAVGLLALVVTLLLLPRLRRAAAALDTAETGRGAVLARTLGEVRTVKALALDGRHRRRWDAATAAVARARLAERRAAGRIGTAGRLAERVAVYGAFALGAAMTLHGAATLSRPALFAFLLLTWRVAAPLRHLGLLAGQWAATRAAGEVVFALAAEAPEAARGRLGVGAPTHGVVAFGAVDFTYPGAVAPALHAVSFVAKPGAVLAIVGRNGAGKTTIARLLQRLHEDYGGLIKVDGIDIREYDLDQLRRAVAVVGAEATLFPGTVRAALLAARPSPGPDAIAEAVRLAGAETLLARLPDGLDTMLDEGATRLSGGERQHLAIARALLADPRILILDEATAALDAAAEAQLAGNLRRIAVGRTVIVVSQRLALLAKADVVLVLDRGEVQDIGRHQDLMQRSDVYAGLWARQAERLARLPATPERRLVGGSHVA